jgi:cobalt-zinc-cadmium efflux system protein
MALSVDRSEALTPTFNFLACYCGVAHSSDLQPDSSDSTQSKLRRVSLTLVLLTSLFGVEWGISLWSGSLSVQADAGHLVSDVVAVGITMLALWLGGRPAIGRATFGHQRLEILAALVNGLGLLLVAVMIGLESWERLHHPQTVLSLPMVAGGALGLVVNGINLWMLRQNSRHDLNLRAAFLHTLADVVSSIGILVASVSIHLWQWLWMDTVTGFLVAGFTAISSVPLILESLAILLNYAPTTIDPITVEHQLLNEPDVQQVNSLKIWQISANQTALCGHLTVSDRLDGLERDRLIKTISESLKTEFLIQEITLQVTSMKSIEQQMLHPIFQKTLMDYVM